MVKARSNNECQIFGVQMCLSVALAMTFGASEAAVRVWESAYEDVKLRKWKTMFNTRRRRGEVAL